MQRFGNRARADKANKTDKKKKNSSYEDEEANEVEESEEVGNNIEKKAKLNFFEEDSDNFISDSNDVEFSKVDDESNMETNELSVTLDDKKLKPKNKKIKQMFKNKFNCKNDIKKRIKPNNKELKKSIKKKVNFNKNENSFIIKKNADKLHPSWEAAKLNKQKLQATINASINGNEPTGKHIIFD